jgi:hypothetical protein
VGGEVRVYNGKQVVSSFNTEDTVSAMRFGSFGRENHSLILVHKVHALQQSSDHAHTRTLF